MNKMSEEEIRAAVRQRYGLAAIQNASCCGGAPSCCGGVTPALNEKQISAQLGYSEAELSSVPVGSNLGLGCGNPQAIAALKPGEVVLDLGSGAGFDCFLAVQQVGPTGRVIGVDMTPDMVAKARANAAKAGYPNISFRLGEIEALPVANDTVDVIISNCVINLSPDKEAVFAEAFRVLKPGGRLAISDVVATAELPQEIRGNLDLYAACAAGALAIPELESMIARAGFVNIQIKPKDGSRAFIKEWMPGRNLEEYILSAVITAEKPER
ncbi:MAG TPA: arsenite methyltransferase [bacterium]|nr:arsenite methyltransferase [bacterium]HQG47221.1 arsenite methyltransferase [bacterium]HQI47903.1 arsenite methyltransferase [bacterium]HQJ66333.1 arsenite methyltransferase [bacterium]